MQATPHAGAQLRAALTHAARTLLRAGVALTMLGIMGLTVVNVFMRYVLDRPISGSDELVQFLLALLVFSAFPLVTVERRHFSVSVLARAARGALKSWSVLLELSVSTLGCAIVCVQLFQLARLMQLEQMSTMVLQLPLAPLDFAISALAALALLGVAALLVDHVLAMARGERR